MKDLEALREELQSHKEWLKSRDEQIWRYYVKALDDGQRVRVALEPLERAYGTAQNDQWGKTVALSARQLEPIILNLRAVLTPSVQKQPVE